MYASLTRRTCESIVQSSVTDNGKPLAKRCFVAYESRSVESHRRIDRAIRPRAVYDKLNGLLSMEGVQMKKTRRDVTSILCFFCVLITETTTADSVAQPSLMAALYGM